MTRTILLLHAGIANAACWDGVRGALVGAGHDVLAPDLRGFGSSPDPDGPYDHVADLVAVLDGAGADRVDVVGWSFGGSVAAALAHEHPDRVRSLACCNAVPPGFERAPQVLASWEREAALWEAGDFDGVVDNDIATWVVGRGRTIDEVDPEVVRQLRAIGHDLLGRYDEAFDELDRTRMPSREDVLALPQPLLFVCAELDWDDVRDAADAICAVRGDAVHRVVAGCAHAGPMERPDAYARHLLEFLDTVPA